MSSEEEGCWSQNRSCFPIRMVLVDFSGSTCKSCARSLIRADRLDDRIRSQISFLPKLSHEDLGPYLEVTNNFTIVFWIVDSAVDSVWLRRCWRSIPFPPRVAIRLNFLASQEIGGFGSISRRLTRWVLHIWFSVPNNKIRTRSGAASVWVRPSGSFGLNVWNNPDGQCFIFFLYTYASFKRGRLFAHRVILRRTTAL